MESKLHSALVEELARIFQNKGWIVRAIDGITNEKPSVVENNGIGDRENKIPDIEAYDSRSGRIIRGEAKIGNGDIESEHSITQYQLFSNRNKNGVPSWLYIIVPKQEHSNIQNIVMQNVTERSRENIGVIASGVY